MSVDRPRSPLQGSAGVRTLTEEWREQKPKSLTRGIQMRSKPLVLLSLRNPQVLKTQDSAEDGVRYGVGNKKLLEVCT